MNNVAANENDPSTVAATKKLNSHEDSMPGRSDGVGGVKAVDGGTEAAANVKAVIADGDTIAGNDDLGFEAGAGQKVKELVVDGQASKEEEESKAVVAHNDGIYSTMLRLKDSEMAQTLFRAAIYLGSVVARRTVSATAYLKANLLPVILRGAERMIRGGEKAEGGPVKKCLFKILTMGCKGALVVLKKLENLSGGEDQQGVNKGTKRKHTALEEDEGQDLVDDVFQDELDKKKLRKDNVYVAIQEFLKKMLLTVDPSTHAADQEERALQSEETESSLWNKQPNINFSAAQVPNLFSDADGTNVLRPDVKGTNSLQRNAVGKNVLNTDTDEKDVIPDVLQGVAVTTNVLNTDTEGKDITTNVLQEDSATTNVIPEDTVTTSVFQKDSETAILLQTVTNGTSIPRTNADGTGIYQSDGSQGTNVLETEARIENLIQCKEKYENLIEQSVPKVSDIIANFRSREQSPSRDTATDKAPKPARQKPMKTEDLLSKAENVLSEAEEIPPLPEGDMLEKVQSLPSGVEVDDLIPEVVEVSEAISEEKSGTLSMKEADSTEDLVKNQVTEEEEASHNMEKELASNIVDAILKEAEIESGGTMMEEVIEQYVSNAETKMDHGKGASVEITAKNLVMAENAACLTKEASEMKNAYTECTELEDKPVTANNNLAECAPDCAKEESEVEDTPERNVAIEDSPVLAKSPEQAEETSKMDKTERLAAMENSSDVLDKCAPDQENEASELEDTSERNPVMEISSVAESASGKVRENSELKEASEVNTATEESTVVTENTPEVDIAKGASDSAKSGLANTATVSVSDQEDSSLAVDEADHDQHDNVVECLVPRLSDIIKAEIRKE